MALIAYVPNEYTPIFTVLPAVFIFLWVLIVGDFKNFKGSKISCSNYTAEDPVNCYQNYKQQANGKPHTN